MAFGSSLSQQDTINTSAMFKQDGLNSRNELVVENLNNKVHAASKGIFLSWTDEQIVKLNEAVALFGNNWESVSKYVGRSKEGCAKKYKYVAKDRE